MTSYTSGLTYSTRKRWLHLLLSNSKCSAYFFVLWGHVFYLFTREGPFFYSDLLTISRAIQLSHRIPTWLCTVEDEPEKRFIFHPCATSCYCRLTTKVLMGQANRINAALTNNTAETVRNTYQRHKKGTRTTALFASARVYITQVNPALIGWNSTDDWLSRVSRGDDGDQGFISGNEVISNFLDWKDIKFFYSVGIAFASVAISLLFAFWAHSWGGSKLWNPWLVNTLQMWGCELSIGANTDPLQRLSMETSEAPLHSTSL